ncbi:MAG TPA: hypothetical protein VIL97_03895, partial [Thermoanaerobaculia bacterium]
ARKYGTSCATCHAAYPKLNYFGKAFRNNGYRYPAGTDADMTKEAPVSLGAEGYKKLWPRGLWPADIAGSVPVGLRAILRVNEFESDANNSSFEFPHEVELFAAGTIGDTLSYFGEIEIENENNENELEMGFALQYDPRPDLHVRLGTLSPHSIPDHLRLTAAHYSPYDTRTTPSSITLRATNPNNPSGPQLSIRASTEQDRWRLRDGQPGVELWGARNGAGGNGGLSWTMGIVNGQGLNDANDDKDLYGRVAYKFGGYGELGGGEPPEKTEFWRDDSFKVGGFFYKGSSTNVYAGSVVALDPSRPSGVSQVSVESEIQNDFDLMGVEFDWWFRDLNLFGMYLWQNDDNPRGSGEEIDTAAWFVNADYTFYPWLIGVLRYGQTDLDFATSADPDTQEFLVPALVFMARANVKFTAEGQLRLDDPGEGTDRYLLSVDFSF